MKNRRKRGNTKGFTKSERTTCPYKTVWLPYADCFIVMRESTVRNILVGFSHPPFPPTDADWGRKDAMWYGKTSLEFKLD